MFEPDTRADETGFDSTDESGFESTDSSEHDAGGADGEYVEKSRVVLPNKNIAKNVEAPSGQTPRKRRKTTSSINTGVKLRVVALDPYGGICLLTGALKPRKSRQFCHIVARRTSAEVLTMLEWWWQLAYWTLYIDTRYNILILMANWHLAMDGHEWTFVPHHQLITNVLVWARAVIEQDPTGYNKDARTPISESYGHQTNFLYYMLPLDEDMEEVVIHRYPAPVEGAAFDPTAIIPHLHPFTTIGPLTSHMHPHFVIFSAGQKLTDLRANVPLHERAKFMEGLAAIASFGHTGDAAEIKLHNLDTLTALLDIYALWSSTEHVPQAKSGHQWRKHPKAPEE
ncbi:hypothetical protein C8F04DRAFT_677256 [Mycena alexandri]|uniref:HNH nuclease domain-containing protein n=1 Tax=Mycena alexandri TaxID=1745969 RepID=A0AAD6SQW1_9AGAR|nr:hypothetical protein C8F04DRAFT_677256 [Mycena alexandri]